MKRNALHVLYVRGDNQVPEKSYMFQNYVRNSLSRTCVLVKSVHPPHMSVEVSSEVSRSLFIIYADEKTHGFNRVDDSPFF